jgi:regulator of RNase E activity RraA
MMQSHADEAGLVRRLALLETSALSDVLDGLGFGRQVLHDSLRPLTGQVRMAGRAACVALGSKPAGAAPAKSGDYFSAVDEVAAPGRVLVLGIAAAAPGAAIGGFMGREYQRRGAAGVLTNGAIRDAAELQGLGFAVFGAGVSPRNGAKNLQVDSVGQPVQLPASGEGTVLVADGDFIVADPDGIAVIPAHAVEEVLGATEQLAEMERRIARDMAAGMVRIEAMRAHKRFAHLPAVRALLEARKG